MAIKCPPSQAGKSIKCPGYAQGGCLSFDLTGTLLNTSGMVLDNLLFQKYSYPPKGGLLEIPRGSRSKKKKILQENMSHTGIPRVLLGGFKLNQIPLWEGFVKWIYLFTRRSRETVQGVHTTPPSEMKSSLYFLIKFVTSPVSYIYSLSITPLLRKIQDLPLNFRDQSFCLKQFLL